MVCLAESALADLPPGASSWVSAGKNLISKFFFATKTIPSTCVLISSRPNWLLRVPKHHPLTNAFPPLCLLYVITIAPTSAQNFQHLNYARAARAKFPVSNGTDRKFFFLPFSRPFPSYILHPPFHTCRTSKHRLNNSSSLDMTQILVLNGLDAHVYNWTVDTTAQWLTTNGYEDSVQSFKGKIPPNLNSPTVDTSLFTSYLQHGTPFATPILTPLFNYNRERHYRRRTTRSDSRYTKGHGHVIHRQKNPSPKDDRRAPHDRRRPYPPRGHRRSPGLRSPLPQLESTTTRRAQTAKMRMENPRRRRKCD